MAVRGRGAGARLLLGASVGWLGISMVADGLPALLLPYSLSEGGGVDGTTLGLVTLVAIGLATVIQPIAGRWSDVHGRFPVMAVGGVAAVGGLGLLAAGGAFLPIVGTVVALAGVSVAQAGQQALLPDRVERARRGVGAGIKGAFDIGGALLAFVVLAALLGAGELRMAAGLLAAALAGSVAAGYLLLRTRGSAGVSSRSPDGDVPVGRPRAIGDAFRVDPAVHGPFVRLVVARFLVLLGVYVVGRFLFLFVGTRFGLDPGATAAAAGFALAVLALVTIAASMPAGWLADHLDRRPVMIAGAMLTAVGVAAVPLAGTVGELVLVGSLIAIGSAAFGAGSWALLADLAVPPQTGRLLGLAHLGTAGAAAAAGAFGPIIDAGERAAGGAGYSAAFMLAAVAALGGGYAGWRLGSTPRSVARSTHSLEVKT